MRYTSEKLGNMEYKVRTVGEPVISECASNGAGDGFDIPSPFRLVLASPQNHPKS